MSLAPESSPATPPHHPIHDVHLPESEITRLIQSLKADLELISAIELPSTKSWNNRIYFLKVRYSREDADVRDWVLKVNGRFFGPEKVENEVACLLLLQKYCATVPSPKVLAWATAKGSMTIMEQGKLVHSNLDISQNCWILMTRMPGEPISVVNPNEQIMVRLSKQLADHVTSWRCFCPAQKSCGNIRFVAAESHHKQIDYTLDGDAPRSSLDFMISGFLGDNIQTQVSMTSVCQYYRVKLEHKIHQLESTEIFSPNIDLVPRVRSSIFQILERMEHSFAPSREEPGVPDFVFTHYDLSPRNVLVAGNPPEITGIVDFEFAGFFAPLEEFLNDHVHNDGDWPKPVYDAYLQRLEMNGIATPSHGLDPRQWQKAIWMEQLIANIAPWWLPGKLAGDELFFEFQKARGIVEDMLECLSS